MIMSFILSCLISLTAVTGSPRIPCILLEFKDVRFDDNDSKEYFDNLFNGERGLKQYYSDNSLGTFVPEFDILGPVTLDKYRAFYGRDVLVDGVRADAAADQALAEACLLLDPDVDFSVYDKDGDGVVDMIMFVYAGHDQSQGGPFEAIWAHQWFVSKSVNQELVSMELDGVRLDSYCCGPQLSGADGKVLSGFGIFAHEFGHAIGLPDLYDMDTGDGHTAWDTAGYALMCYGTFNNGGFTPPYITALERMLLGWLQKEDLLQLQPGWQVLAPLSSNTAYYIPTGTDEEYFILEYRDSKGWDTPLPAGLAVYHVDRSEAYLPKWENWRDAGMGINDDYQHPCFYLLSSAPARESGNLVFPGLTRRLALEPSAWDGTPVNCQLTNIRLTDQGIGLYAQFDCGSNINGYVTNTYGDIVKNAVILLEENETTVDEDGHFIIEVPEGEYGPFTLKVSAPGYRDLTTVVSMDSQRVVSVPLTLKRESEGEDYTLVKYNSSLTRGYYNKAGTGAVKFSPADLASCAGSILKEIVFYPYILDSFEGEVFVTVDVGTERVLTRKVETLAYGAFFRNSIDVSDAAIVIPEGEDVYIGYGCADSGDGKFYLGTVYPGEEGNSYWSSFDMERSLWSPLYVPRAGLYMNLALQASAQEQAGAAEINVLGYSYIRLNGGTPELVTPENSRIKDVKWFLDGFPVSGAIVPQPGYHVLEAKIEYNSGVSETISKAITAE